MPSSKVYKAGGVAGLQSLRFVEFAPDGEGAGGGVVAAAERFREEPLPGAKESSPAGSLVCSSAGEMEQKVEEAFARGKRAGMELMESRLNETILALTAALEENSRLRETLMKNSTSDMVRLVMAIAEQVIHCEVATNGEVILQTIKSALQAAISSDEFRVKVNPEDFALVTEKKPLFLASISGLKNIVFEADHAVTRGGCLVESKLGEVDATIESQLEEIRQHLDRSLPAI